MEIEMETEIETEILGLIDSESGNSSCDEIVASKTPKSCRKQFTKAQVSSSQD